MTVACVIPARFDSSRFPGKLLSEAHGKTVLQRTFEQASSCKDINILFVATDDEKIAKHIQGLGGEVIWTSRSCQNGTERIGEALQKDARLQKSSIIVNLQGDHPCTRPETLSALIQILKSDSDAEMSTAATPIHEMTNYFSPHVVKCVFDSAGNALYFSRSPIPYLHKEQPLKAYAHIGIYCYRTEFLKKIFTYKNTPLQKAEDLEQLKVLENRHRIKIAVVEETLLGIDTPEDLEKLRELLCQSNISLSRAESFPR